MGVIGDIVRQLSAFRDRNDGRLLRVIPVASEISFGADARLIFPSIEVWTGWFKLNYVLISSVKTFWLAIDEGQSQWHRGPWFVEDDTGTKYQGVGGVSGSTGDRWDAEIQFVPELSARAKQLVVRVSDPREHDTQVVELNVSSEGTRNGIPAPA